MDKIDIIGQNASERGIVSDLCEFETITPLMSQYYVGRLYQVSGLACFSTTKRNIVVIGYTPQTDPDILLMAYMHELGHLWDAKVRINSECRAWEKCYEIATQIGHITISPDMADFALACMHSYDIHHNTWIYRTMSEISAGKEGN